MYTNAVLNDEGGPEGKWRAIFFLAIAELLAMGTWFSASATANAIVEAWHLTNAGQAWLTMSVQLGFVIGSLISAIFNIPDRISARKLFSVAAFLSALCTALIPLMVSSLVSALILRFLTGFFVVGVYPVGMKLMATWTKEDRGFGIGLLVGALTLGSGFPHLLRFFTVTENWQPVLYAAAFFAALGGLVAALFVREGPYGSQTAVFNLRFVGEIFRKKELRLANFGYLGHMWELFAMWTWVAVFFQASIQQTGGPANLGSLLAFAVISVGAIGSVIAGKLADRLGRTTVSISSLAISGLCSLTVGLTFGKNPILIAAICLIWGFAVVADSAQFSAAISELCNREYIGTALTIQTSLGFLLTLITIRLIPTLTEIVGWTWAFSFLALGPLVGIIAMGRLRTLPEASLLANGNK